EVLDAGVIGQHERDDRLETAAPALLLEQVRDGGGARGFAGGGLLDGGGEGGGAVVVQQVEEPTDLHDTRIAVRGPLGEERVERGDDLPQALPCGDRPGGGLGLDQRGEMGGV